MRVHPPNISFSFEELRQLAQSFELTRHPDTLGPVERASLLSAASRLGTTAIPICVRQLETTTDSACWATDLLIHLATTGLHAEVTGAIRHRLGLGDLIRDPPPTIAIHRCKTGANRRIFHLAPSRQ